MKRLIDYHLLAWKSSPIRQPLLLRGARQVGKTTAVRKLGESFESFVEINLEENNKFKDAFERTLAAKDVIVNLEFLTGRTIVPGQTLLFIDEIQAAPQAILALRYLYEQMPELHVIAAGSLLDFAIEKVGVPVGRVQAMYMYPLTFIEYLAATNHTLLIKRLLEQSSNAELVEVAHDVLLHELGRYLALGGMPKVLQAWIETQKINICMQLQSQIIDFYRQDFTKYAKTHQIKYVELLFQAIPLQLSHKFRYSDIDGEYRKRELAPALELLSTAGIVHKIYASAGNGIPLGAQANPLDYKTIALDIGLTQKMLDADLSQWFIKPLEEFINKGQLLEAFIGLELIGYANPHEKKNCYYWHREERTSSAEVDYLLQLKGSIIPIEVKSGKGNTIKSMRIFLESHPNSPYGIRFSTHNFSKYNDFYSYPLYAACKLMIEQNMELQMAIESLL